jgi:hypothetical protein
MPEGRVFESIANERLNASAARRRVEGICR